MVKKDVQELKPFMGSSGAEEEQKGPSRFTTTEVLPNKQARSPLNQTQISGSAAPSLKEGGKGIS